MSDKTKTPATEASEEAPRVKRLWVSVRSGHVVCEEHAGASLRAVTETRPRQTSMVDTSLDTWWRIDRTDADLFDADDFTSLVCDQPRCGARF